MRVKQTEKAAGCERVIRELTFAKQLSSNIFYLRSSSCWFKLLLNMCYWCLRNPQSLMASDKYVTHTHMHIIWMTFLQKPCAASFLSLVTKSTSCLSFTTLLADKGRTGLQEWQRKDGKKNIKRHNLFPDGRGTSEVSEERRNTTYSFCVLMSEG